MAFYAPLREKNCPLMRQNIYYEMQQVCLSFERNGVGIINLMDFKRSRLKKSYLRNCGAHETNS